MKEDSSSKDYHTWTTVFWIVFRARNALIAVLVATERDESGDYSSAFTSFLRVVRAAIVLRSDDLLLLLLLVLLRRRASVMFLFFSLFSHSRRHRCH